MLRHVLCIQTGNYLLCIMETQRHLAENTRNELSCMIETSRQTPENISNI